MTNDQLNLTFMWWWPKFVKLIKHKLGIRYVIMRAGHSSVLHDGPMPMLYADKQQAHKDAKMCCGVVATYRKAMKLSRRWNK